MKNNTFFKRIGAYLIDFLVITLISAAFTKISFINPKYDKYVEASEKYTNTLDDYYKQKITIEEFNEKTKEMSYDINKTGAVYIACDMVIIIFYFGVFAFVTKGQTLGKKLMNIKIVSNNDKPLKIYQYFIRSIILNGIIMDMITLIAICFSRNTYYSIYTIGSNLNTILEIAIVLMVLFTSSGRGLHDILAGTKVINAKEEQVEAKEEVEVIKPKKDKKKDE